MDLGKLTVDIVADLTGFNKGLTQAERSAQRFGKTGVKSAREVNAEMVRLGRKATKTGANIDKAAGKMKGSFAGMVGSIKRVGGALAAAFVGNEIIQAADRYTQFSNALRITGLEGEKLSQTQRALVDIANQNGVAVQTLAQVYSRANLASGTLKASQEEILEVTAGVGAALKISGRSASESSGALLQLSQALASGTVRAEEFNSILEGAPELARAVARGMYGTADAVARVRQGVIDGTVSSKQFFEALKKGLPETIEMAREMELTVGQAFQVLINGFTMFVGQVGEQTGIFSALAGIMQSVGIALYDIGAATAGAIQFFKDLDVVVNDMTGGVVSLSGMVRNAGIAMGIAFGVQALIAVKTLTMAILTGLVPAVGKFFGAITKHPLGRIITVIAAIIVVFGDWIASLEIVQKWFGWIKDAAKSAFDWIIGKIQAVVEKVKKMAQEIRAALSGTSEAAGKAGGGLAVAADAAGYAKGGAVKAATGGMLRGPGTGTSDSIPAMLSDGEFVVNAKATKKALPLLAAINEGKPVQLLAGGTIIQRPANMQQNIGDMNLRGSSPTGKVYQSPDDPRIQTGYMKDRVKKVMAMSDEDNFQHFKENRGKIGGGLPQQYVFQGKEGVQKGRRFSAAAQWRDRGGNQMDMGNTRQRYEFAKNFAEASPGSSFYGGMMSSKTKRDRPMEERFESGAPSTNTGGGRGRNVTVVNVNDASQMINVLGTSDGEQKIVNTIKNNAGEIKNLLGVPG